MKILGISTAAIILTQIANCLLPATEAMTRKEIMIVYMLTFLCISMILKD